MARPSFPASFSAEKAHALQWCMSQRIIFDDCLPAHVKIIAGVDVAYSKGVSFGAAVAVDYESMDTLEIQATSCRTCFPYIPTLLSFREVSPSIAAIRQLTLKPDLLLVNGHGFAHPYRCGFASHLGFVLNRPTIGVTKTLLVGKAEETSTAGIVMVEDKGEVIGARIKVRPEFGPVYVSVGHKVSLHTAIEVVKHCILNHRLPEPILKAHEAAAEAKRKNPIF